MNHPVEYMAVNDAPRDGARNITEEFATEFSEMKGCCLDIGAGPGDVTYDFILPKLDPSATIVCADLSETMVNFGKKMYKDNDRLSFIQLDILAPNMPDSLVGKFDHVFSFSCLHWCRDMKRVFENVFKLLKPGGTAFMLFIEEHRYFDAYKVLAADPKYAPYMKDAENYVPVYQNCESGTKVFKTVLEDIGFQIIHCTSREAEWFYTPNHLKDFIMATGPFADRMPIDLQKQYQMDMIKVVTKEFQSSKDENGGLWFRWHRVVAYFKKPLTS